MKNKKNMTTKIFPFNPIETNCFVCYDETGECVIIDPSCGDENECNQLFDYMKKENLTPKHVIITHPHVDHIVGTARVCEEYNLSLTMHKAGLSQFGMAIQHAEYLGLKLDRLPEKHTYVEDGDIIKFGNSELKVFYTPGHSDGSICLVNFVGKTVFTGDVLFHGSIGRTDLMTGNFDVLKKSIYEKLFVLGDDFTVRPGHGGRTEIGFERYNNPFL
jgi:glyoxylase-like metal-dependent hydrolase (beta-lactamase superfamily II)